MKHRSITLIEDYAVDKLRQAQSLLECQQTATHHSPIGLNAIRGIESLVRSASDGLISWEAQHGFHQVMNRLGLGDYKALQMGLYEYGRGFGQDLDAQSLHCLEKLQKANRKAIKRGLHPGEVLGCNVLAMMDVMDALEPGWGKQFNKGFGSHDDMDDPPF